MLPIISFSPSLDNSIPCDAAKRLIIGTSIFASCNGNGGGQDNPYSFDELMANGGSIYVNPSSNAPICYGDTLSLFANPSGTGADDPTNTFSWTGTGPGGPYNSTLQNPSFSGLTLGTYTFTVTIVLYNFFLFLYESIISSHSTKSSFLIQEVSSHPIHLT